MRLSLIVLLLGIFVGGCDKGKGPDVSGLMKEQKVIRFDREIFSLNRDTPDIKGIRAEYGRFFDLYAMGILQLGSVSDPDFPVLFALFLNDSIVREVYDSTAVKYTDMSEQEKGFSKAFAYYSYYFPKHNIPAVYTHISGFNQSVVIDSAMIGISLDNYLGEDCVFYKMLATPIPRYVCRKMTERNIVKDALFGWLSSEFVFVPKQNDLISGMIYQGKICYLLEKILPDYEPERLFDYTPEQLKWCEQNEAQIWGFLIENEYLFSTQQMLLRKYLNDSPFTSGMPTESPGRAVIWTGYRIVKAYMDRSKVSLDELTAEQDYHKILRGAGYRP